MKRLTMWNDAEERWQQIQDIHIGQKDLNAKLAEYENLEEKGLLLRLPCKVGDMVFVIGSGVLNSGYVTDIRRDNNVNDWYVLVGFNTVYHFSEFGRKIFLNKEEAQKALEH